MGISLAARAFQSPCDFGLNPCFDETHAAVDIGIFFLPSGNLMD
jgi:hypothetical protein